MTKTQTALLHQIESVMTRSRFYREKLARRRQPRTLDAFLELPFTTKQDLLTDQVAHPPYGSTLCIDVKDIQRIHKTSGTTASPLLIAMSRRDVEDTVSVGAACFRAAGVKRTDTVVHCLNYNMWAGGYTDHQSLERAGAAVIPFGVGNTKLLIDVIRQTRATAIHCTPSFLGKLEDTLMREHGVAPLDLGLRLGLFGAEPGLQNPDFRAHIERTWGLRAMNANYGLSEALSMCGAECEHQQGLHYLAGRVVFAELIDPVRLNSVPVQAGAQGELVLTHRRREAQPLVRYRTGDVVRVVGTSCGCSRRAFRFDVVGRTDSMLVIRGLNVFPSAIDEAVYRHSDVVTTTYEVAVSKLDPISAVVVTLELRESPRLSEDAVRQKIVETFTSRLHFTPIVQFVPEGSLARTEGKARRVSRVL